FFVALYARRMPDRRSPPAVAATEQKPRDLQLADNRKALFDYSIEDRVEAGIALTGTEIKTSRCARESSSCTKRRSPSSPARSRRRATRSSRYGCTRSTAAQRSRSASRVARSATTSARG